MALTAQVGGDIYYIYLVGGDMFNNCGKDNGEVTSVFESNGHPIRPSLHFLFEKK